MTVLPVEITDFYLSSMLCSVVICECKTLNSYVCLLFSFVEDEGKLNNLTLFDLCQFKAFLTFNMNNLIFNLSYI